MQAPEACDGGSNPPGAMPKSYSQVSIEPCHGFDLGSNPNLGVRIMDRGKDDT